MAEERRTIIFSGNVQGVGFRFTACRTADDFDVAGTVRNMHDGTVECVIEGESSEIDKFISAICDEMGGYIHNISQQTSPFQGEFVSFGVAF